MLKSVSVSQRSWKCWFSFLPLRLLFRSKSDGLGYHHPFESVIAAAAAGITPLSFPLCLHLSLSSPCSCSSDGLSTWHFR